VDSAALLETQSPHESATAPWPLTLRIAFRFCFVYFSLFCLYVQIVGSLIAIPKVDIPDLATLPPLRPLVFFVASHLFGIHSDLVYTGSGSGDKTYDWVMIFCFLVLTTLATALWTILDRRRLAYPRLFAAFVLFLRFGVGGQMLGYGLAKLFPMQMPFPSLTRLLEPYGNFSPMGALWYSIGASPAYEMLCGSAEVLAAILLFIPRTALLGALVTVGVTSEIFILNMTYDVPVKLLSFHLLLMALFLASPEFTRLATFFLTDRSVAPSNAPRLFHSPRTLRIALIAQLTFAAWLIGTSVYGAWGEWGQYGAGAPKSPLYGIWNIDKLVLDGQERSPLLGDYGRWKRLLFDSPESLRYQRMDETFGGYTAAINPATQTIALTKSDDKNWKGTLHYTHSTPGTMTLDGNLGNQSTHMDVTLMDRNKLMLVSRGFHWVQEYPFNR
jgi:hypothetical protein